MASATSASASGQVLPASTTSHASNSSLRLRMMSAARTSIPMRFSAGVPAHCGKNRQAPSTASRARSASAFEWMPTTSFGCEGFSDAASDRWPRAGPPPADRNCARTVRERGPAPPPPPSDSAGRRNRHTARSGTRASGLLHTNWLIQTWSRDVADGAFGQFAGPALEHLSGVIGHFARPSRRVRECVPRPRVPVRPALHGPRRPSSRFSWRVSLPVVGANSSAMAAPTAAPATNHTMLLPESSWAMIASSSHSTARFVCGAGFHPARGL